MDRTRHLVFAMLLGAALLTAPCGCRRGPGNGEGIIPAEKALPAPAWSLEDAGGGTISSADFSGKVVVLDFWATWCPPCRAEIPGYISLQSRFAGRGLAVVGVSLDEGGAGMVLRFIRSNGINYPVVMGNARIVADYGGIEGIPTTFIIDRQGRIRHKKVGMIPHEEMERLVLAVLGEG